MLYVVVFVCGASVMILETLGSRVIAPYFGSTLYVWTALIGMIMMALSLGYFFGGRIADKRPRFTTLLYMIAVAAGLILCIPPLAPYILMVSSFFGFTIGPIIAALILFVPAGVFLGMVSPFAIRLSIDKTDQAGSVAGKLSALSTFGSIIGTFLNAFWLIPSFGVNNILYGMSVGLICIVLVGLKGKKFYIAMLLLLIFVPTLEAEEIVYLKDGPYNQVAVADYHGRRWLLLNGISQGGAKKLDHSGDLIDGDEYIPYQEYFHLASLVTPQMKEMLILGLGSGYGDTSFKSNYPGLTLDVVEIDPVVVDVAKKYYDFTVGDGTNVFIEDGRMHFVKTKKEYDVVVFDAYGSSAPPFHLTTREAFKAARDRMTDGGVLVVNIISSLEGPNSRMFQSIVKTIGSEFKNLYIFPKKHSTAGANDPTLIRNIIILADNHAEPCTKEQFAERAQNWQGEQMIQDRLPEFSRQYHSADDFDLSAGLVLTDQYAPVEVLTSGVEELVRAGSVYRLVYLSHFQK